ncbi:class I SAM-dependent methyltransferase [Streptomonospora wellingtoniae]|uniref:Methyltransferase domain-containing protein n=1 Tax=Streptomonospora wellingtoniae TaxID=3075544 RepID=A0ABU2KQ68_9ACTN|nr:methyltransferase [Streptomonospora sp. DSM 45055]MDT0301409.1 methyltransferase domain-containing protein [Streptomonospora sp. DSM 45055]
MADAIRALDTGCARQEAAAAAVPAAAGAAGRLGQTGYLFDNDSDHAVEQHGCLAAAYDPATTQALARTGAGPGWRCLEVGGGGGSVGRWLARRVAPRGSVMVTDIKPVHIPHEPGMAVVRHDVVREGLPECAFDLVHARLVLMHLPEREAVLARLLRTLRPGGWLQLDELDATHAPSLAMPDEPGARLYARFQRAKLRALAASGADPAWGAHAAAALRRTGFADVDPRPHVSVWSAGAPGARLQAHHTRHLRKALLEAGMTDEELAQVRRLLAHPDFLACSPAFYTVQGRRP